MGNRKKSDLASSKKEWDNYWGKQNKSENSIYGFIAGFYRKFIIKNALNHFTRKYFKPGSKILHAGCGSGQVDEDISNMFNITALDISKNALDIYKQANNNRCKVVQGSIFKIPSKEESFDGIYNLGVMEHFTKNDIHKILLEFRRVLKPEGRLIIFWPPEFGATVIVLKVIHFFMNKVLHKKTRLHPLEITRIKSKEQATQIFEDAGFSVVEYYFGIKDAFTHTIIVASKSDY